MTIQQVIAELKNINEQAINNDEIGKESIIEALTDLIREVNGGDMDYLFEDEDNYGSYEQTDFSKLNSDY
jgi:hypothetical protein